MRLTSKGLGRLSLPFILEEAVITVEKGEQQDELWFRGDIVEKTVNWDYKMRMDDADIVDFIALARKPSVIIYLARQTGFRLFGRLGKRLIKTVLYFLGIGRN